jgi:hypothetical protein
MAMTDPVLSHYLSRHAEPEAAVGPRLTGTFGHAIAIPAYAEGENLFRLIGSIPGGPLGPVLVVLVLNSRVDSPPDAREANQGVRSRLERELPRSAVLSDAPPIRTFDLPGATLLLVDRAAPGFFLPEGQGVGLARKIGCDVAAAAHAAGKLASSWMHTTDADALLPRDYFERLGPRDAEGTGAAIYPFEHSFDGDAALATAGRLYEASLRYYVLGLAWAGSPYAYQSMGSCLAVPVAAYARVRGFPRRNALEDFYALNKLAKVGLVRRLSGAPLKLEGRISERVPISTGKALAGIVSRRQGLSHFRLYHPAAFGHLAAWIRVLSVIARTRGDLSRALAALPSSTPFFRTELLSQSLEKIGAFAAIREAVEKSGDSATLLRHLHTWFDAFRTLKLIHGLRDGGLPLLPYRDALAEAPFTELSTSTEEDPEKLRLALLEKERELEGQPAGVVAMEIDSA